MIALRTLRRLAAPIALLGVVAVFAAGCGGSDNGSASSGVVAVVNGEDITQEQFDELMGQVEAKFEANKQELPAAGSQEYVGLQQSVLQYLVERVKYSQKAEELGVDVTDKQVQERLDRMIKQFYGGSEKKYLAELKKQGFTDEQWREQLRMTLVADGLAEKVGSKVTITDAEIEDYYKPPRCITRRNSR
jgi:parvulin-like peptidyl-prolyl isomerase